MPLLDIGSTDRFLAGLNAWVAHETPTSDPAAVNALMDEVQAGFAALGAACERVPGRDGRGDHLVIRAPWGSESEKGVLCLSHLDTVHPIGTLKKNPIRTEGNRAWGPGINDMKAGAYAVFAAYRALVEAGQTTPLPLTFIYTADEETGSVTSQSVIEREAARSRYALVLESGRAGDKVVTSRKGAAMYRLEVSGRPAHAGSAHRQGRSAIRELAHQILTLEGFTDYARGITVSIGLVEGGSAANVVPASAWCSIDMRAPTPATAAECDARIKGLAPVTPDCTLAITGGINRTPYLKAERPDIEALFQKARAVAKDIGFDLADLPDGEGSGGSDAQFCVASCPALDGLGPYGGGAHTIEEWIGLDTIPRRGNLLLHLLQTLA